MRVTVPCMWAHSEESLLSLEEHRVDNLPELLGLLYFSASPPVLLRKENPEGGTAWICLMVLRDPCVTQLSVW